MIDFLFGNTAKNYATIVIAMCLWYFYTKELDYLVGALLSMSVVVLWSESEVSLLRIRIKELLSEQATLDKRQRLIVNALKQKEAKKENENPF